MNMPGSPKQAEFDVVVFPDALQEYTAQIYAGLYDLASEGTVTLHFSNRSMGGVRPLHPADAHLWMDVTSRSLNQRRNVLFDMIDPGGFRHLEYVERADIVIKRSFNPDRVQALPVELRARIRSFGLQFACRSRNEKNRWRFQQQVAHHRIHANWKNAPVSAIGKTLWKSLVFSSGRNLFGRMVDRTSLVDDFVGNPSDAVEHKVFFRTRLYSHEPTPHQEEINEFRVSVVRALKSYFGDRFVGGLRRSPMVEKRFPDCLFPYDLDARGHIAESSRYLINVNTKGLHQSTGWKLPEILAAARCAVSESPVHVLPYPLVAGHHYFSFDSPDGCVAACERLLDDPELAAAVRKQGFQYYKNYLAPGAIVHQALARAFA